MHAIRLRLAVVKADCVDLTLQITAVIKFDHRRLRDRVRVGHPLPGVTGQPQRAATVLDHRAAGQILARIRHQGVVIEVNRRRFRRRRRRFRRGLQYHYRGGRNKGVGATRAGDRKLRCVGAGLRVGVGYERDIGGRTAVTELPGASGDVPGRGVTEQHRQRRLASRLVGHETGDRRLGDGGHVTVTVAESVPPAPSLTV